MPNGDVLISVLGPTNEEASFFGREHFESTQAGLGGGPVGIGALGSVQRADGRWIVTTAQSDCTRGVGSSLNLHEAQGAGIRGTSFVFVSEYRKHFESITCEEVEQPGFTSKVVVLEPTGVVELKDGSFLIAEQRVGLVLRVRMASDGTVCTESELLGKSLFIVDSQWLWERFRSFASRYEGAGEIWPAFFENLGRELKKAELQGRC